MTLNIIGSSFANVMAFNRIKQLDKAFPFSYHIGANRHSSKIISKHPGGLVFAKFHFDEFMDTFQGVARPVLLIEGKRDLPDEMRPSMVHLTERIARENPGMIFRTGNAKGSDEAFAAGVIHIDASRLEYVLPHARHRTWARPAQSRSVSLTKLKAEKLDELIALSIEASPKYTGLFERYHDIEPATRARAAADYLLRDTLKVTGDHDLGLDLADAGLFYVDPDDPNSGGTGHTVRVCLHMGVPVYTQAGWMSWLSAGRTT